MRTLPTLKAELQALRASTPAVLHAAIDARLEAISKTERQPNRTAAVD
ncbi:MAG: hypothetical protein MJA27_33525 [Pseudanabaenales cyanobacterium]|nr:hypothetical protein [Pseudanabaenales cyanobacterium]